jgi:hypothetical protein
VIHLLLQGTSAASTAAASSSGSNHVGTDYPVALFTALLMGYFGYLIINRVAGSDPYVKLRNVMLASLILHLLCAPLQILVVDHFYGGIADWLRYSHQGALLSDNWRAGQFTTEGTGIGRIVTDGAISIYAGIIMTVVGPNLLASFFVASFCAFAGTVFFYMAFRLTFPEARGGRYAVLVFLFPSLLFWTADVGKESSMLLALGLTAYGMALILKGRGIGYIYTVVGGAVALVIRPDEVVILVVAFALAMVVRGVFRQGRAFGSPIRVVAAIVVIGAFVVLTGIEASHFLHQSVGGNSLSGTLNSVTANNSGVGEGYGSSNVAYSSNPLFYPRDIYTVLFDPPPFLAHSVTQLAAAAENTLIFAVIVFSFRQLRCTFRASFQRPYVFVCVIYTLVFIYAFAALGNLGLITRERTLVLPFLFVLLAIPLAPEGQYPYPWQVRRRLRRRPSESERTGPVAPDEETGWVVSDAADVQQWHVDSLDGNETTEWSPAEWMPDT